jgi:filamentous hemagglutinin family protein
MMMFRLNTLAIAIAIASNFYLNNAQALPINALPTGGQSAQGQVSIQQSANQILINQNSPKAVINWNTFNIGKDAGVTFNQPNAQSSILNRVINGSSEIAGQINANGQVFLLNPNGVLFSPTAHVNTASLVVATGDISDTDYLNGRGTLHNSANGVIINQGNLTVAQGGKIVLSSQQVNNAGHITANDGVVQLLAGQRTRVNITADGLIATELEIDNSNNANIQNSGIISATGGRVDLLAAGPSSQISHTGIIEAQSTVTRDGKIYLVAGYQGEGIAPKSGSAVIDGQLNVSAPSGGNGGFVETSAGQIKIGDHTQVTATAPQGKTGLWLIDPHDFTIAASGGDISGATLSANLANGDITILSSSGANSAGAGDINVNDNVSWNANLLTLTAAKDININAVLSVNGGFRGGSGRLDLNTASDNGVDTGVAGGQVNFGLTPTGFSGRVDFALGGQGLLNINNQPYWIANTISDLQDIFALSSTNQFVGNFAIGQNLDASTTSTLNNGLGFNPLSLGNVKFEGLGHVIDRLFINRPTESQVGLFGNANGLMVSNLGLSNVNISGHYDVGALIGYSNNAVLSSYATGQITGASNNVGGLIGTNDGGNVTNSYFLGAVTGADHVGGLVGTNVNGQLSVGQINHSYARGSVNGNNDIGGLVGLSQDGVIHGSYATSDVTATGNEAGGLVGGNTTQGVVVGNFNITDTSYASGTVSGSARVGGLVGYNEGNISNSYATGKTSGTSDVGGLIGLHLGNINNSYWDTQGTGQSNPIGTNNNGTTTKLTGLTTAQMHQLSSFGNWGATIDATGGANAVWRIYEGNSAPLLRYFLKPITVTVDSIANSNQTLVYNGSNQTLAFQTTQSYSTPLTVSLSGDPSVLLQASGRNTGDYVATLNQNALFSHQQGYDISLVDQTTANTNILTISPAPLVISSNDVFKIYDGTTNATGTAIVVGNTQLFGTDYLTGGSFIFDNKNVVTNITVPTNTNTGTNTTVKIDINAGTNITGTTNKNAGTNKTLTISNVTVKDTNGGNNYTVTYAINTNSQITPATLTVKAIADNKIYDATTAATAALTDNRLTGDVLNISSSGADFSDKNVGIDKNVTVNGVTLTGKDAANYTLATGPVISTANITPATLTVKATADNKVYNATTAATTALTDNRLTGDVLNISSSGADFSDKNVGIDKNVTVNGVTLTGKDAANYTLATGPVISTANITPATLTVKAIADNKIYDATTAATTALTDNRLTGDVLNISSSGADFSDKNVGIDKNVTVNGVTLTGKDAANYTLATGPVISTANITPATLTVKATADNKVYDATTAATATLTDNRLSGDLLNVCTCDANFSDKNVGSNKNVTVNGVKLTGKDAANYILATGSVTSTADITPATLIVSATADNKVFDATTAATATLKDNRLTGDVLNISSSSADFSDKNVGIDKEVTVNGVTLSGTDAANYRLALPVTAKANIERLPTDVVERKLAFNCSAFGICPVDIQSIAIKPNFDVNLPPSLQECEAQNIGTTPTDCILKPKQKIQITTVSDDDGQVATPIQSKRALIIANSNYQNVIQLAGVKKDSQAIHQELAQLGYQVTVVDDANRADMIKVLNQMIEQSNRDDSVLIYYAGHGYVNNGSSVGYWLPTDARIDHGEQWISTLDIARFINNIAAKQILLVSDSCFSGSLSYEAALQTKTELNKNAVLKRRSVMVLTSGSEEPVADSSTTGLSPFAASFVQSIGQVSKDSDLRGQSLYKNVFQQVTSRFKQYPTYGGLDSAGNMLGGEYIFEKK